EQLVGMGGGAYVEQVGQSARQRGGIVRGAVIEQPRAIGKLHGGATRHFQRKLGLADAAGASHGDQPVLAQQLPELRDVALAADQRFRALRQARVRGRRETQGGRFRRGRLI